MAERSPTDEEIAEALAVLLWLHESRSDDGRLRDEISHVRAVLDDELDARG